MLSDPSDLAALLERHVLADEVDLASLVPPGRCAAAPLCCSQSSCCHAFEWLRTMSIMHIWSMNGTTKHDTFPPSNVPYSVTYSHAFSMHQPPGSHLADFKAAIRVRILRA